MAFWTSFLNKYTATNNSAARVLFILFALTAATQPAHAQLQELVVTPISVDEALPVFLNHPGMAVIIIRSSLTTLTFDSNYHIVEQQNDPAAGEYILIFEPVPQTIRVNAPGFMAQGIPLRGLSPRQVVYYSVEPAPDPESGRISVLFSVQPEQARLYVNGELSAANQTLQIEPGPAQVRIELDGYRLIEDQIDVSMDNIFFSYSLEQIDIVPVRISAGLPGTAVTIDGTLRGETDDSGILGLFLYPGQYSIDLQRSGYLALSRTITVTDDGENRFEYTLQRNVGRLVVQVTPGDARVELNRQDYSGQPRVELAPGRYRLDVSREGYEPYSESIEIILDEELSRTVLLEPHRGSLQFLYKKESQGYTFSMTISTHF